MTGGNGVTVLFDTILPSKAMARTGVTGLLTGIVALLLSVYFMYMSYLFTKKPLSVLRRGKWRKEAKATILVKDKLIFLSDRGKIFTFT